MTEQNSNEVTKNPKKKIMPLPEDRVITLNHISVAVGVLTLVVAIIGFLAINKQNRYQNQLAAFDRLMPTVSWGKETISMVDNGIVFGIPIENTGGIPAIVKTIGIPIHGCQLNEQTLTSAEIMIDWEKDHKTDPRSGYYLSANTKDDDFFITVDLDVVSRDLMDEQAPVDFVADIHAMFFYRDIWFFEEMVKDLQLSNSALNPESHDLLKLFFDPVPTLVARYHRPVAINYSDGVFSASENEDCLNTVKRLSSSAF